LIALARGGLAQALWEGSWMGTPTRSQTIASSLAQRIVEGQFPPGHKLDEHELAARYEVSRTPVRDALLELSTTRLIEYSPRRGFSVAHINFNEFKDIFEAASEVEALCGRLCALRAGPMDLARIEQIHEEGQGAADRKAAKDYAAANERLHAAIYAGTHNETIERIALDLRKRLAPFRARVFYSPERIRTSVSEHDEIVRALIAQDSERAAESMRSHAARSVLNVLQHFSKV
jgi:DNA-binding GntR family transcriptional regulator